MRAVAAAANEPKVTPGRSTGFVSKLGVPAKQPVRTSSKSSSSKLSPRAAAAKKKDNEAAAEQKMADEEAARAVSGPGVPVPTPEDENDESPPPPPEYDFPDDVADVIRVLTEGELNVEVLSQVRNNLELLSDSSPVNTVGTLLPSCPF